MKRIILSFLAIFLITDAIAATESRGYQAAATNYRQNQRNTYYMITQPDIASECNNRIYQCFSSYCGDMTVIPGQSGGRCNYVTENELYNWAILCLQKDNTPLLPQYGSNGASGVNGMNNAARLCPSYIQSGMMSYLSMANMAEKLTLQRSDECVARRQDLSAAISCHQVALAYGTQTQNQLVAQLTDSCGPDMPGGSTEMVQRFANAGNLGANILGWAEKLVSIDVSSKGPEWQSAMDQVLAYYTNKMNITCGDDMQINTPARGTSGVSGGTGAYPTLTTIATVALNNYGYNTLQPAQDAARLNAPAETIWKEVYSASDVYDFNSAKQIVNAGLTNSAITQNSFLSSAQMSAMQSAYKYGTKVFVLRDSARCYIVPVSTLSYQEQTALGQVFSNCVAK